MVYVKLEAVRPRKGKLMKLHDFYIATENAFNRVEKETKKLFQKTTKTWDTPRPRFKRLGVVAGVGRRLESITIGTTDDKYAMVNYGTRPHDIFPRNVAFLKFYRFYSPKTMVGIIDSRKGGRRGGSGGLVYSLGVEHPGTEGRRFDEAIQQNLEQRNFMQNAVLEEWSRIFGGGNF